MKRQAAVAGHFYPDSAKILRRMIEGFLVNGEGEERVAGILSPHAGYIYSGAIAGETFARIRVPGQVVILGPNHHGIGQRAALYPEGSWENPLGETPVAEELAADIQRECPLLRADPTAHLLEHSLEVQVPFIQIRSPEASIVPICLGSLPLRELIELGEGIGRAIAKRSDVLMVASTDMTHYESGESARQKDSRALERVLALDPEGLWETVRSERISMCGVVPTVVMLAAARYLGATSATLVRYGNSGEITGDQAQVVGYAGVLVS